MLDSSLRISKNTFQIILDIIFLFSQYGFLSSQKYIAYDMNRNS